MKLSDKRYFVVFDVQECKFLDGDANQVEYENAEPFVSSKAAEEFMSTFDDPWAFEIWEVQETAVLVKKGPYPRLKTDFIDLVNKRNDK